MIDIAPAFMTGHTRSILMRGASNPNKASAAVFAVAHIAHAPRPFVCAISMPTTSDVPHAQDEAAEMPSLNSLLMATTAFYDVLFT